ncbi:hypothetical protein scyTo_0022352, partial [Scyliorhinus torazame]|nr:hypothetical protein [Scyliorhinus torazame]
KSRQHLLLVGGVSLLIGIIIVVAVVFLMKKFAPSVKKR